MSLEPIEVSYPVFVSVATSRSTWPMYHHDIHDTRYAVIGAEDVAYSCMVSGAELANHNTTYVDTARSTLTASRNDSLALLSTSGVYKAPHNTLGIPMIADGHKTVTEAFRNDGHLIAATVPGGDTYQDMQVSPNLIYMAGASFHIGPTSVLNDYAEFSVVDKDNVLGLFALYGLVPGVDILEIVKYVRRHYIPPCGTAAAREPYSGEILPGTVAPLAAGLYMRVKYHSTGLEPVWFIYHFHWFET